MADFASEQGGFYLPSGEPYYTVISKSTGEPRPTTLRDARKVGALPRVSTVIKCAAAPGLDAWKMRQLALAMATLPRIAGESEDDFITRAMTDSREEGKRAAERGESIHGAIERVHRGETCDVALAPWVEAANNALMLNVGEQAWLPERSFASPLGYGGKVDLHSPEFVVDVKSKDGPLDGKLWPEHAYQLGAYRVGLRIPNARCGILFVRRDEPQAMFVEVEQKEVELGFDAFMALLKFWQVKNRYFPNGEVK